MLLLMHRSPANYRTSSSARKLRNWWLSVLVALISLLSVNCSQTISEKPKVSDSFCSISTIIRPSIADTEDTHRQIATHNTQWRCLCAPPEQWSAAVKKICEGAP